MTISENAATHPVLADGLLEARTSRFLLALDEHHQVDLHFLPPPQLGRSRSHGQDRALVVRDATAVQPAVLAGHRERVVRPDVWSGRRNHIIVAVEEDALAARRFEAVRARRSVGAESRENDRVLVGSAGELCE